MTDKDTTKKIMDAVDRFDREYSEAKRPKGYRMSLFIILGKAIKQELVDMDRLMAFPTHDFIHDMTGLYGAYDPASGVFSDTFLPRSVR